MSESLLYDELLRYEPTPVVELTRAVAVSFAASPPFRFLVTAACGPSSKPKRHLLPIQPGETTMQMFDVQAIEIQATPMKVFEFVREPGNLPRWAHAFKSTGGGQARLETPAGTVDIGLSTEADSQTGTVDWRLEFADGSIGLAQSRVTKTTRGTCIYSFVLHAPPVPLEQLEGALAVQRLTLAKELLTLKSILET